jgi:hypothetical protein
MRLAAARSSSTARVTALFDFFVLAARRAGLAMKLSFARRENLPRMVALHKHAVNS